MLLGYGIFCWKKSEGGRQLCKHSHDLCGATSTVDLRFRHRYSKVRGLSDQFFTGLKLRKCILKSWQARKSLLTRDYLLNWRLTVPLQYERRGEKVVYYYIVRAPPSFLTVEKCASEVPPFLLFFSLSNSNWSAFESWNSHSEVRGWFGRAEKEQKLKECPVNFIIFRLKKNEEPSWCYEYKFARSEKEATCKNADTDHRTFFCLTGSFSQIFFLILPGKKEGMSKYISLHTSPIPPPQSGNCLWHTPETIHPMLGTVPFLEARRDIPTSLLLPQTLPFLHNKAFPLSRI